MGLDLFSTYFNDNDISHTFPVIKHNAKGFYEVLSNFSSKWKTAIFIECGTI